MTFHETIDRLEKENTDLHNKLAAREDCMRDVMKRCLAIMEEITAEFAYHSPTTENLDVNRS